MWKSFRSELESDSFVYTYQESIGNAKDTNYYIDMESNWRGKDWPDALYDMVEKNASEDISKQDWKMLNLSGNGGTFYVPESCPKTRELIKTYIGDNVEYTPYDMDEKY